MAVQAICGARSVSPANRAKACSLAESGPYFERKKEPAMSASDLAIHAAATRPPAPIPNETPLGSLAFLIRFWQNPLATWTRHNFEWPITQADGVMGRIAVVCDPAAIRRVFIDNVANYR